MPQAALEVQSAGPQARPSQSSACWPWHPRSFQAAHTVLNPRSAKTTGDCQAGAWGLVAQECDSYHVVCPQNCLRNPDIPFPHVSSSLGKPLFRNCHCVSAQLESTMSHTLPATHYLSTGLAGGVATIWHLPEKTLLSPVDDDVGPKETFSPE